MEAAGEYAASSIVERLMLQASQNFGHSLPIDRTALLGGGPETWHVRGGLDPRDLRYLALVRRDDV